MCGASTRRRSAAILRLPAQMVEAGGLRQ